MACTTLTPTLSRQRERGTRLEQLQAMAMDGMHHPHPDPLPPAGEGDLAAFRLAKGPAPLVILVESSPGCYADCMNVRASQTRQETGFPHDPH